MKRARAGPPRMYRARSVQSAKSPGAAKGPRDSNGLQIEPNREGPEGNQERIALAPTALDSNCTSISSLGALGRTEPGAAGATQAGRHRPTADTWPRNTADAADLSAAAALGRNVGV